MRKVIFLSLGSNIVRPLTVLALAQLIGWGTVGLLSIVGRPMAADLHMSVAAVFSGNSVLYVVMGLWAPFLARAFTTFGARQVMIGGAAMAVPGFVLLAHAQGPALFFTAWAILGTAGSATLTTAAYILLNEIAGRKAKSAVVALMLVTGLSSSVFWPTTSFLFDWVGWRTTCLIYSAAMAFICLPLYVFGLPRGRPAGRKAELSSGEAAAKAVSHKGTFYLIVAAIALNAFVTFGFSAILVELFKAEGLKPAEAVGFGSILGVVQVSARGLDLLGGGRWDGIATGLFAGIAVPIAMLVLGLGAGSSWSIMGFVALYGLGSGALAVARATIPLVFYDKAAYAKAASQIALPLNFMSALAPPVLIALLTHFGSNAVLGLAVLCSCGAFLILFLLRRRRPLPLPLATAG